MIRPLHRPLAEDLARAKAELRRNTSIEVYGWRDGAEYRRRPGNQWARLAQAAISVKVSLQGFSEALQAALGAMPAASVARSRGFLLAAPPRLLSVDDSLSPAPLTEPEDR